jgi:acyl-CoA synthetase (AMP-forming)/AMP-acid ligase II/acyl carrier protein
MSHVDTLSELLATHAARRPQAPAVKALDRPDLSYQRLDRLARSTGDDLRAMGIEGRDRVVIVLPNGPEMATAFLSVALVAEAAPLNPAFTKAEFAFYLEDLKARAVVVADPDLTECTAAARELGIPTVSLLITAKGRPGEFSLRLGGGEGRSGDPVADPGIGAGAEDTALVLHTSGTTGRPKIVPLSHRNLCRSAANVAASLHLTPEDVCLNVMPLFHIHGLVASLLASLHAGGSVVCTPGFQAPSFFSWAAQAAPTWYTAVPTMHQAILSRAGEAERAVARKAGLRLIRSSSASLPPSVLQEMEETFGIPVVEAYGMTEAAHQMASNPLSTAPRKAGSVGPAAGPEVAIVDDGGSFLPASAVGEVVIRGPNVTRGYYGLDDQSRHFFGDGWFRTGDQGYLDQDGYLFLTGRLKEIINRGGETIAPREIDEALLDHEGVEQAVAFAVPDSDLGEEVAAVVVLASGAGESEGDLQRFLLDRLSWPRIPKRIVIVDEIPKGPTGKVQRIGLAEKLDIHSVRIGEGGVVHGLVQPHPGGLAEPGAESTASGAPEDTGPRASGAELLERLGGLWREVLQLPDVDPDTPFQEAGGDSVTATVLVMRVEEEFKVKLPLLAFFDAATLRRQAELLAGLGAE